MFGTQNAASLMLNMYLVYTTCLSLQDKIWEVEETPKEPTSFNHLLIHCCDVTKQYFLLCPLILFSTFILWSFFTDCVCIQSAVSLNPLFDKKYKGQTCHFVNVQNYKTHNYTSQTDVREHYCNISSLNPLFDIKYKGQTCHFVNLQNYKTHNYTSQTEVRELYCNMSVCCQTSLITVKSDCLDIKLHII